MFEKALALHSTPVRVRLRRPRLRGPSPRPDPDREPGARLAIGDGGGLSKPPNRGDTGVCASPTFVVCTSCAPLLRGARIVSRIPTRHRLGELRWSSLYAECVGSQRLSSSRGRKRTPRAQLVRTMERVCDDTDDSGIGRRADRLDLGRRHGATPLRSVVSRTRQEPVMYGVQSPGRDAPSVARRRFPFGPALRRDSEATVSAPRGSHR
jgi:hypothetical protein